MQVTRERLRLRVTLVRKIQLVHQRFQSWQTPQIQSYMLEPESDQQYQKEQHNKVLRAAYQFREEFQE